MALGRRSAAFLTTLMIGVLLGVPPAHGATSCAPWCSAVSTTRVDSVYPRHSMPDVDALHYDLQLQWAPRRDRLRSHEDLRFRAARTVRAVHLALGPRMHVSSARLDGHPVQYTHHGALLALRRGVAAGTLHRLVLSYGGRLPQAPPIWGQRNAVGMFHMRHRVYTNDEPVGAFTWYAVDDQPSDKAYYDFRLSVPSRQIGVANGRLTSERHVRGETLTRFHLDRPSAAYLITAEFGRYRRTPAGTVAGTPVTVWTPSGQHDGPRMARHFHAAVVWAHHLLGRFPFRTLSLIVVHGYGDGMENQTLVTMGDHTAQEVNLVHEVVHQWYGDEVTPRDWRDVWMNEGMAMYAQDLWTAGHGGGSLRKVMAASVQPEREFRAQFGPPGNYDPSVFAAGNIYFGPALMWDQLRKKVGGTAFWSMVRAWPAVHAYGNADRADYLGWVQHRLDPQGRMHLPAFFHAWLMDKKTPPLQ